MHDLKDSFRGVDLKLFVRDVRDRLGRKRPITVRTWSSIKDVKDKIQQAIHVPLNAQRLYFGPLLTSGKELPNHRTLHDAGIYRSGETLLLDIKGSGFAEASASSSYSLRSEAKSDVWVSSSVVDSTPRLLRQLVQQARRALALGLKPEFVLDGSGGTYFLHDARKCKISVFKPADEEPYAVNNPRGYLPQPGQNMFLREGIVPGEACIREVAAFILDHGGFSAVPMTTLVEARHPSFNSNGARLKVSEGGAAIGSHSISTNSSTKSSPSKKVGSFQEFVRAECSMDDLSPSMLSADEVHKIAILDIRLLNADRNSANLLCRRRRDNSIELVPIDHGFCLRSVADVSWMDWCWLDWPQMKQPLSEKTKEYILNLDIEKDARVLKERLNICTEALDYFCASCSILKAGVKAGLSLYEIAVMCCRNDDMGEIPSKLEVLFSMATELAESAIANGRWHHAAASRALAEQLSPKGGSLLAHSVNFHMTKSLSALTLPNLALDDLTATARRDVPGMIQSSASDSSSDTGDNERDDCEEWAAALIMDVSLDKTISLLNTKQRSPSIESDNSSDSGNSSSEKGFWYTHPGSPTDDDLSDEDDDDSVDWEDSPFLPKNLITLPPTSFADKSRNSSNSLASARRSSLIFSDIPGEVGVSTLKQPRTPPKVSFAEDQPLNARFKQNDSEVGELKKVPKPSGNTMKRSQSYSVISSSIANKIEPEEENSKLNRTIDHEQYRDYFLKFIDLVIVRETTAASRTMKQET